MSANQCDDLLHARITEIGLSEVTMAVLRASFFALLFIFAPLSHAKVNGQSENVKALLDIHYNCLKTIGAKSGNIHTMGSLLTQKYNACFDKMTTQTVGQIPLDLFPLEVLVRHVGECRDELIGGPLGSDYHAFRNRPDSDDLMNVCVTRKNADWEIKRMGSIQNPSESPAAVRDTPQEG
jgi:hypothetical protein